MGRVLFSLLLAVTACGSAEQSPSFDASRVDKWNGVYRLESVSTMSSTVTPTGNCEITLRHVSALKYEQTVEFDCQIGPVPIVKRSKKELQIDDFGKLTLLDGPMDAGTEATISPTYYVLMSKEENNVIVMSFRKQ